MLAASVLRWPYQIEIRTVKPYFINVWWRSRKNESIKNTFLQFVGMYFLWLSKLFGNNFRNWYGLHLIANVLLASGKGNVANAGNHGVNTAGEGSEPEVSAGSAFVAFRTEIGVIDNNASNPAKEPSEQETNNLFIHNITPFF